MEMVNHLENLLILIETAVCEKQGVHLFVKVSNILNLILLLHF